MGKKSASYFRKKSKENYKKNKELSKLYNTHEANPGESFTEFSKRFKKKLGTK